MEEKILLTQKRVKKLYNFRKLLAKRLGNFIAQQTKYYNKRYKSKSFVIKELIMLSIKNLKQKRFSKKILYKYVKLFRIKNKIKTQAYRLILLNIYRIYNTFYILLLKLYLYCVNNKQTKQILQVSKLINNKVQ